RFSLMGPAGFAGFTDLTDDSGLVTLTASGTYTLTAHGTGGPGGVYAFRLLETSQVVITQGTTYAGTLAGSGQAQLFRVDVPATPAPARPAGDHPQHRPQGVVCEVGSPAAPPGLRLPLLARRRRRSGLAGPRRRPRDLVSPRLRHVGARP